MGPDKSGKTANLGTYGFRLSGLDDAAALLNPVGADNPEIVVERAAGGGAPVEQRVGARRAVVHLAGGAGFVEVDRDRAVARFVAAWGGPPEPAAVVHPFLTPAVALFAWWRGWPAFHAGAFVADGGAWAVLGERGAGKSSTLGWLARQGFPVLADDLLVVVGDGNPVAAAGPRCLDLRPDAAAALGMGTSVGVLGARERWRAPLEGVDAEVPLRGFVYLGWGDAVSVTAVRGTDRLQRLLDQKALYLPPGLGNEAGPPGYLEMATLPAWTFRRPPGLASLAAVGELVEAVSAGADG